MLQNCSNYIKNAEKSVLIVGLFPPPLGGVSVHCKRATQFLCDNGHAVHTWDIFERQQRHLWYYYAAFFWYLLRVQAREMHYHGIAWRRLPIELGLLVTVSLLRRQKLIVYHHSVRFLKERAAVAVRCIIFLLNFARNIVNDHASFLDLVYTGANPTKIDFDTPYIRPDLAQQETLWQSFPRWIHDLTSTKRVLLLNAASLLEYQGNDLYGIDLALACIDALYEQDDQVALLIVLGSSKSIERYNWLRQEIQKRSPYVFLLCGYQEEMWPLLKHCALFIRPTRSDTLGISVLEALDCGIPAIASDTCERPHGTLIHKSEDAQDLIRCARSVLYPVNPSILHQHEYHL